MISPADIENIQFKATRLKEGYDQDEVDNFLDRVAADYAEMYARWQRLEVENAALKRRPTEAPTVTIQQPPSVIAERLLEAAEEAAKRHEAEAKDQADQIVRDAGAKGAATIEEATVAAETIKRQAQAEGARMIEEAQLKALEVNRRKDELAAQVVNLDEKRATYKLWLQSALQQMEREDGNA